MVEAEELGEGEGYVPEEGEREGVMRKDAVAKVEERATESWRDGHRMVIVRIRIPEV